MVGISSIGLSFVVGSATRNLVMNMFRYVSRLLTLLTKPRRPTDYVSVSVSRVLIVRIRYGVVLGLSLGSLGVSVNMISVVVLRRIDRWC